MKLLQSHDLLSHLDYAPRVVVKECRIGLTYNASPLIYLHTIGQGTSSWRKMQFQIIMEFSWINVKLFDLLNQIVARKLNYFLSFIRLWKWKTDDSINRECQTLDFLQQCMAYMAFIGQPTRWLGKKSKQTHQFISFWPWYLIMIMNLSRCRGGLNRWYWSWALSEW